MNPITILQLYSTNQIYILKQLRLLQISIETILWYDIKHIEIIKTILSTHKEIYWTKNSKLQGRYISLCNSEIWKEYFYKNGKREGSYKFWWHNNQIAEECVYVDDKREGPFKSWYENGRINEEGFHKKGKLEGSYKQWCDNGKTYEECFYKDGKLEGPCKRWYIEKK